MSILAFTLVAALGQFGCIVMNFSCPIHIREDLQNFGQYVWHSYDGISCAKCLLSEYLSLASCYFTSRFVLFSPFLSVGRCAGVSDPSAPSSGSDEPPRTLTLAECAALPFLAVRRTVLLGRVFIRDCLVADTAAEIVDKVRFVRNGAS